MIADEGIEEVAAKDLLERVLQITLTRPPLSSVPTPDYVSEDPPHAVEVKRFTSQQQMSLLAADQSYSSLDTDVLKQRWTVVLDVPTTTDQFPKMPNFPPDPPPEEQAHWAEAGMSVVPREERIKRWKEENGPHLPPAPNLKNLPKDMVPFLGTLEEAGITSTRGLVPWAGEAEVRKAVAGIYERAGDCVCEGRAPIADQGTGVDVTVAWGTTRSQNPNDLVERVCRWLNSDVKQAANLRKSFADVTADTARHAVVPLDSASSAEWWTIQESGFNPTVTPDLPDEVDSLWLMVGQVTLSFHEGQWSKHEA